MSKSCHTLGLYSYQSRSSPRGVSRALEARSGNAVGRRFARYARAGLRRLKSPGSGEPAARHKDLTWRLRASACQRANGEAGKVRQRRITWYVLRGPVEGKPKTIRARDAGIAGSLAAAASSALLFFVQRAVMRFWRSRHPARPRIFARAIWSNPGAPARGKDGGCLKFLAHLLLPPPCGEGSLPSEAKANRVGDQRPTRLLAPLAASLPVKGREIRAVNPSLTIREAIFAGGARPYGRGESICPI